MNPRQAPSGAEKLDNSAPKLAPFYWGIKDGADPKMLAKVRKFVKLPYFMNAGRNMQEVLSAPAPPPRNRLSLSPLTHR